MLLTEQNILILQFVVLIFFFFYNIYIFTYLQDFFYTIYNVYTVSVWVLLSSSSVVVWVVVCVDVVPDNGRGGSGNSMGMATE